MKKTYINPTMDVVEINICNQLLAGSTLSLDDSQEVTDENNLLSREVDEWPNFVD